MTPRSVRYVLGGGVLAPGTILKLGCLTVLDFGGQATDTSSTTNSSQIRAANSSPF